jgi:hypothetical protein
MTEPWHDECRRLRAEGLSQPEIALRVKRSRVDIRFVLNESAEQKLDMKRLRERLRRPRTPSRRVGGKFVTYWAARAAAPGAITPQIKREAILAFSRHEIDRRELMLRITPADKWSRGGLLRVE